MNETRIISLEKRVRQLNLCVALLALVVMSLGIRQIAWMQAQEDWEGKSAQWERSAEQRLQVADSWEGYWNQQVNEGTTKQERQR